MKGELPPYPAYQDSGVPWLGQVPVHWQLRRTKTLVRERSEKGYPNEPLLAATQTKGVVRKEEYENRTVIAMKDLQNLKLVRVGDFVISLRSFQGGIEYAREQGIISPAYTVLYPMDPQNHAFLALLFKSKPYIENLNLHVTGIRQGQNVDYEKLSRSLLPLPPPAEQAAIVRYLDHVGRRIRRYIRAKRRLLALLAEQKQAIIHQAVTRGLDPDAPLKPSGVAWLGDVPAHWEVVRIKSLLREIDERSTTGEETLLAMRMNHGLVPYYEHFSRPAQAATLVGYKIVRPGQVAMNRLQANNGLVFASTVTGLVSPDYAVFIPIVDVDLEFLTTLFRSNRMKAKFRAEAKGLGTGTSGFLRLYSDSFGMIQIALPPRDEQTKIMSELEWQLQGLNHSSLVIEKQISLLREYRTRLIADVVTGQVDVRAAAANLPAEFDAADEPLDEAETAETGEDATAGGEGDEE